MNRFDTRSSGTDGCPARTRQARARGRLGLAVAFLGTTFAPYLAAPARAVGPRIDSDRQRIEIPETIVVSPEISRLPGALVDLRGSLARPLSQGWYGIGLSCSDCTISRDDSVAVWSFSEPPEIRYVDPDGPAAAAGLRRGDVLVQIDGMPITSREGGRRFGATKPGDRVRWIYERNGKKQEVTLAAEAHPERELFFPLEVSADVEEALADLHRKQAKLLEESELLRKEELDALRGEVWKEQMEAAQEALERVSKSLRREGYVVSPGGGGMETRVLPSKRQNLRYEGSLGSSEIEVLGSGSVVVTEDRGRGELLITTPDATIRIRTSK